jgi:hypothetical protein
VSPVYKEFCSRNLEEALSFERFSRYIEWAEGDKERALYLYGMNTALSEALYTPLQMLEVTLRNRFHTVLSEAFHEHWFDVPEFLAAPRQLDQLAKAKAELTEDGKDIAPGRIVAALTFGFWTAMLSPHYENLWQTTLHGAARKEDGKGVRRKDLSGPLAPIRVLRNRIAHHEPIITWNVRKHYANMLQITRWLSPDAADWCIHHSRFDSICPEGPLL